MITRIVKLEIQETQTENFRKAFKDNHQQISNFPGCLDVKLVFDSNNPKIHFTISTWESETDIENYRNSQLFKSIWSTVKPWFENKAQAWSTVNF